MESAQGSRVLVCDDTSSIRQLMRVILELEGYVVDEAETGCGALEMLAAEKDHLPVAVLVDVHMAPRDGWWVIEQIRADPAMDHLPVVLVSAALHGMDLEAVLARGFDAVLPKPFDPDDLVEVVSRMVEHGRTPGGAP